MNRKLIAILCSTMMLVTPLLSVQAKASMIGTGKAIELSQAGADERTERMAQVRDFMQQSDVRDRLVSMGVSPEEADARLDNLTDGELAELSERLEDAPAGGAHGVVIAALLVLLIFFLFVDHHHHHH